MHPRGLNPGGTYSPYHAGHPAGAGFLPRLPTLPLACFLAPIPLPLPGGRLPGSCRPRRRLMPGNPRRRRFKSMPRHLRPIIYIDESSWGFGGFFQEAPNVSSLPRSPAGDVLRRPLSNRCAVCYNVCKDIAAGRAAERGGKRRCTAVRRIPIRTRTPTATSGTARMIIGSGRRLAGSAQKYRWTRD